MKEIFNKSTKSFSRIKLFSDWDQIRDLVNDQLPKGIEKIQKVRGSETDKSYQVVAKYRSGKEGKPITIPINGNNAISNFEKASGLKINNPHQRKLLQDKVKGLDPYLGLSEKDAKELAKQQFKDLGLELDGAKCRVEKLPNDTKKILAYLKIQNKIKKIDPYHYVGAEWSLPNNLTRDQVIEIFDGIKSNGLPVSDNNSHYKDGSVDTIMKLSGYLNPGDGDKYLKDGFQIPVRSKSLSDKMINQIIDDPKLLRNITYISYNPNLSEDTIRRIFKLEQDPPESHYDRNKHEIIGDDRDWENISIYGLATNSNCPKDILDRLFKKSLKSNRDDLETVLRSSKLDESQLRLALASGNEYIGQAVAKSPSINRSIIDTWIDAKDEYNKWEKDNPDANTYQKDAKRRSLGLDGCTNVVTESGSGASKDDFNYAIAALGARLDPNYEYKGESYIDKDTVNRINDPRFDKEYQDLAGQLRDIYNDPNFRYRSFLHEVYPSFRKLLSAIDGSKVSEYKIIPDKLGKICYQKSMDIEDGKNVILKLTPSELG